jgi:hypothetical protein
MLDDDECHKVAISIRRCPKCQGALAAFAFPESEEALIAIQDLQKDLGVPIFAFMGKDEALHRARVVIICETIEEVCVTPKEFGDLVWNYLDCHVCASWN